MHYLRKLKYTSLFNLLKNNYCIIVFLIVILFVLYHKINIFLILFLILYFGYLCKKSLKLSIILVIILAFIFINFFTRLYLQKKNFQQDFDKIGKVIKIKKTNTSYQVIFKVGLEKVITYSDTYLQCGGIYHLKGELSKGSTAHYQGGFNYHHYLTYQNIIGILNIEKMEYIKKGFSIYQMNEAMNHYFDKVLKTKSAAMIKALTIGNKNDLDESLQQDISNIGISHLFVISGLHINILAMCIKFILKKVHLKEYKIYIFTIIILFIYFFVTGLLISVLRVIISYILRLINKVLNYQLSRIDMICINMIMVLFINPFYIYQYSFILSYITSFIIIISSNLLTTSSKYQFFITSLKISILSLLVTLPIITNINPDINFLSIFYNILYIPFITYIILPMAFLVAIFPLLECIFNYVYLFFETFTHFFANIKIFTITFPSVNIIVIFVYYFIIYFILKNLELKRKIYRRGIALLLILLYWNNISFFNYNNEVYFIDLPKGEATLIRSSHNQANILIDTGEFGYDDIILFLKKQGIKRLDLIIITHSDSDHNGMLSSIIDHFNVKSVYYNRYDTQTKNKIPASISNAGLKANDKITLRDIELKVLSPTKDYQNSNNNSLVILANLFGKKYLFTGDITKVVEEKIELTKDDVDILKVAHHGSNTSSSLSFLNKIGFDISNPNKIAICMNGYLNQFSFPHSNTVYNIQTKLYITSYSKTICIRKNKLLSKYNIINSW